MLVAPAPVEGSAACGVDPKEGIISRRWSEATCASDITLAGVTIRGNGQYGAWLDFPCKGNCVGASELIDNQAGCPGGSEAALIGRTDTACVDRAEAASSAAPGVRPLYRRGS